MDSGRTQIAEALFNDLVAQPPEAWGAALEARCGSDLELRAFVQQLLQNDQAGMSGFLGPRSADRSDLPVDGQDLPERIGPYEIIRRIGEGGMGVVYEARQLNPRRAVAVKVLRSALPSSEMLSRFRHEAHILAQLRHPGIAHIYEAAVGEVALPGGRTAEVPYFAMEFVDARSPRDYAVARRLGVPQRLELIARICDAVQHAHEKGVIHRDLKMDNLLVEESGQPRVLDFGVARLTAADPGITQHTRAGDVVGTLAYMSPEQVSGAAEAVDTRSDVYALGVISYELLAGRLPFDLHGVSLAEAARRIRDDEPARLSNLNRACRGDVETIVAKAMHKTSAQRYESAAALAGDIRRCLRGEPIEARRDSTWYVLGKALQRYRWAAGAVAAVFLALALGVAGTTYGLLQARAQAHEARHQQTVADEQREVAEAVTGFLTTDLLGGDSMFRPPNERDERLSDVVTRAEDRIDAGALADQPRVEAAVRNVLGYLSRQLGRLDRAEAHCRRAVELLQPISAPGDHEYVVARADLAEVLVTAGKLAEAEPLFEALVTVLAQPGVDFGQAEVPVYCNYGELLRAREQLDEAERMYRAALDALPKLQDGQPVTLLKPEHVRGVVLSNLGELMREKKDYAAAIEFYDQSLEALRALYGPSHMSIATALNNKGLAFQLSGDAEAAETLYRESLAMRQELLPANHPDIAQSMNNLAQFLRNAGKCAEAEPFYREALDRARLSLPPGHYMLAMMRKNLGTCLMLLERFEEAETEILACYEQLTQTPDVPPSYVPLTIKALVILYDKWAEADPQSGAAEKSAEWRAKLPDTDGS